MQTKGVFCSIAAVTPRTKFEQTVTAPAGAAKAGVKFGWTGGTGAGGGTAFVDTFYFTPSNAQATAKDNPGEWGAQRIIDFSQSPPAQVGAYRSPTSQVWPPPDDGIYAPRQARLFGNDVAFTTWLSDGLRALDVSNPAAPKEVGSFVPPAVADPSPAAGAGISNLDVGDPNNLQRGASWPNRPLATGVGIIPRTSKTATVVVSDINGGLYVLAAEVDPAGPQGVPTPVPGPDTVVSGTTSTTTGPGAAGGDRPGPPLLELTGPDTQRLPNIRVVAECDEPCNLETPGSTIAAPKTVATLRVAQRKGRKAKSFRLPTVRADAAARTKVTLTLRVPRKAVAAIKSRLKRGRRGTARIKVIATDLAGNKSTAFRTVRIKR